MNQVGINKHKDMIVVRDKLELLRLINRRIDQRGPDCDLNDIDVSKIDDMSGLFLHSKFIGDISEWNVSRVRSMRVYPRTLLV